MASAVVAPQEASPSPSRGLLAKARRKKDKTATSSSNSIISNDESSGSQRGGLRSSFDSAVDKVKSRLGDEEDVKGIQGLIGRQRNKKKEKRKNQKEDHLRASEEAERGRSVAERGTLENDTEGRARSHSRLTQHLGKSESSMITVESDEDPLETPPLVSRPSHAGYLTLSSPLIQKPAESNPDIPTIAIDDPEKIHEAPSTEQTNRLDLGSTPTLPIKDESNAPTIRDSSRSISPHSPVDKDREIERQTSPAAKLREGLGGLFGKKAEGEGPDSRRGSLASRRLSRAANEDPIKPPIPQSLSRPQSARGNLPSPKINTSSSSIDRPSTPTTTVTPPTPVDRRSGFQSSPTSASKRSTFPASTGQENSSSIVTSPSGHMISHRRVRSASATNPPSKLSNAVSAPLTPTIEESKSVASTPGVSGPLGQGGFFSSVFSAATNAATQFSNTIANNPINTANRSRSTTTSSDKNANKLGGDEGSSVDRKANPSARETADGEVRDQTPLAIETLGSGNLSLSHLGIPIESSPGGFDSSMSTTAGGGSPPAAETQPQASATDGPSVGMRNAPLSPGGAPSILDGGIEESSKPAPPPRASSVLTEFAGTEKSTAEGVGTPVAEDVVSSNIRPHSIYESSLAGDQTPPSTRDWEADGSLRRSGSVRSRIDPIARRRRGGSTATGTTIATAIGSSNAVLANPNASGSVPRLTGFAVASKKRNRDFHQLFRSVPEDDYLIEDYSAAIQREILLHGRFYVSEGHICFNSNIFGYVTTLVISFDEVVSVEKKSTAMLFPNAIVIQTLHARNIFASFASRDSTYDLLVGIWKISHPNLRSSLNGVQLDEAGGGDKTMVGDAAPDSDDDSEDFDDQDEVYDEDAEDDAGLGSFTEAGDGSIVGSDAGDGGINTASRKASAAALMANGATNGTQFSTESKLDKTGAASATVVDFPGPTSHPPTDCVDQDSHYEKLIKDDTIPAPLGKVYAMIFGPASSIFMQKWLLDDQKVLELEMDEDKKGLSLEKRTRSYSYIRPLNGAIGPKQTKCIITETLDSLDLEKAVSVTVVTQTPDVPSGNAFSVKTRYCLTWAPGNATRLLMNCTIEWTGKSWLKGPIEKGAIDGQGTYASDLVAAIKTSVTSKLSAAAGAAKKTLRRRKKDVSDSAAKAMGRDKVGTRGAAGSRSQSQEKSWGLLEPLHGPLGPVVDLLRPLLTSTAALVLMTFVLALMWMLKSPSTAIGPGGAFNSRSLLGLTTAERIAAYEEIWRREESQLWDWLEERIGLDGLALGREEHAGRSLQQQRKRSAFYDALKTDGDAATESRGPTRKQSMSEREVAEAIRITQERLDDLKGILGEQKDPKSQQAKSPKDGEADGIKGSAGSKQ
ncbi:MAG: hypothetical protein M4579_003215 [Chaenotheca gracillima]|nr:MAG: hypothetical protein M4579_003215 [Chaenotheca gracillima]